MRKMPYQCSASLFGVYATKELCANYVYLLRVTFFTSVLKSCRLSACWISTGIWFQTFGPTTEKSLSVNFNRVLGMHNLGVPAALVSLLCTPLTGISRHWQPMGPKPFVNLYTFIATYWQRLWYRVSIPNSSCMSVTEVSMFARSIAWQVEFCSFCRTAASCWLIPK